MIEEFKSRCPSGDIIYDESRGEVICAETGEVLAEHIVDLQPEWRAFSYEDSLARERVGAPMTEKVHDRGLHSVIDRKSQQGRKLERLNRRIRASGKMRRLVRALRLMNSVIGSLNLPNAAELREEAGNIIRKLHAAGLIKKKNMRAMVAASIVIATRNLNTPVEQAEIARRCMVTFQDLWNAEMKIRRDSDSVIRVKPLDPRRYVESMASKLKLSRHTTMLAWRIITIAKRDGLTSGKGPKGVAAASLYIASILLDERKTQKEVSRKVDVSEVTIRNRYRDLIDNLLIVVDI